MKPIQQNISSVSPQALFAMARVPFVSEPGVVETLGPVRLSGNPRASSPPKNYSIHFPGALPMKQCKFKLTEPNNGIFL